MYIQFCYFLAKIRLFIVFSKFEKTININVISFSVYLAESQL